MVIIELVKSLMKDECLFTFKLKEIVTKGNIPNIIGLIGLPDHFDEEE